MREPTTSPSVPIYSLSISVRLLFPCPGFQLSIAADALVLAFAKARHDWGETAFPISNPNAFVNSVQAYRLAAEAPAGVVLSEFRRCVGGTDGLDLQFEWAFGALGPDLELPDVP